MNFRILFTATALGFAGIGLAFAADPQVERQELMEGVGKAAGTMAKMVKGETEFDQQAVIGALETISASIEEFPTHFPEGSETGHETEAAPTIWENKAEFEARAMDLKEAADAGLANPPTDLDSLKAMFGPLTKNCGACHEDFRLKKEG